MNYLPRQLSAIRSALLRMQKQRGSTLLNTFILGIAIALPLISYVASNNLKRAFASTTPPISLSVFLAKDSPSDAMRQAARQIRTLTNVSAVQNMPKEQAWETFAEQTSLQNLKKALPDNPLPDTLIVIPSNTEAHSLKQLQTQIAALPGIEHVILDTDLIEKVNALFLFADTALFWLGFIISAAILLTVINTVRLQILTYRSEIELASLIGATHDYVKNPFHWYGILQVCFAGIVSLLCVYLLLLTLTPPLKILAKAYHSSYTLMYPSLTECTLFLVSLALLGWVGAMLSVRQHLR